MALRTMKGAINFKTVIILVILVLVGVLGVLGMNTAKTFLSGAAAGFDPVEVMAKSEEDGKGAVVTWRSDKESMGVVEYGTTPASLLLRAAETEQTTDHRVSLSPLRPNVSYYFRIRIGEEVYDNAGIPYSFKTNPSVAGEDIRPTMVPTVSQAQGTASCDKDGDGRVSSLEKMSCGNQGSSGSDPCDKDGDGRVSSLERMSCGR